MEKKERLSELRNVVYNAEDEIDGIFNEEEYPELEFVNRKYKLVLATLNEFVELLNKYCDE